MKTSSKIVAAAVVLLACRSGQVAHSATSNASKMSSAMTPRTSAADRKYLMENAQGSVYDFATAEVAVQKAGSKAVQDYGMQLLDDHARLNKNMLQLANRRKITLPITLDAKDKPKLMRLMRLSGATFDRSYLREAIRINADDVNQARKELSMTKDAEVHRVVSDFLQTEQKHLQGAKMLLADMSR